MNQQIDPQEFRELRKEVHAIQVNVAKGETAHDHIKGMLSGHIDKSEKWQRDFESQLTAIANAILQETTREGVEKEAEEKAEKKEETLDNKKILIYLAILAGIFAILSNVGEVVNFLAKAFSLLAG